MEGYLGTILMVAYNFAPQGWAFCNGQLLNIAQNTALFAIIGTVYGGDGRTTFGLPNFQSRIPVHQGQGGGLSRYAIGQVGGSENTTLTQNQLPAHSHMVNAQNTAPTTPTPTGAYLAQSQTRATGGASLYVTANTANVQMNPQMIQNTGAGQPFSVVQPYLCVNFIICVQGIFPSRS